MASKKVPRRVTKPAAKRARMPQGERPRDSKGRWLSKAAIAALKGWETRRDKAKVEQKRRARVRQAFEHGKKARERTEARLTPEQRAARKRDAARIERKEGRQRKKGRPSISSRRATTGTATKGRGKSTHSKKSTRTKGTRGTKSTSKRRQTSRATKSKGGSKELTFSVGGSGDALRVQIGVRAQVPAGMEPTNRLVYEAIAHRIDEDEDHPRFRTRIIRWQNPGRKGELREWRQGNQEDAWLTLGPAIRASIERAYGF